MHESGTDRLLSLLFDGERGLANIKFFPGTDRGLTSDRLCSAAHDAIAEAIAKGLPDEPPTTGMPKRTVAEIIASV